MTGNKDCPNWNLGLELKINGSYPFVTKAEFSNLNIVLSSLTLRSLEELFMWKRLAEMNFHGYTKQKNYFCSNLQVTNRIRIVAFSQELLISKVMQLLLENSRVGGFPEIIPSDQPSGIENSVVLNLC